MDPDDSNPGDVIIRPLRLEDLPALEWDGEYRHLRRVYADAYNRTHTGRLAAWVLEHDSAGVIGQAFVQYICDRLELADGLTRAYAYSIRVKAAFRNQGLGSRLILFIEDDLRKRGFLYCVLNVAKDNSEAIRLYKRLGYQIQAHEPGVWSYPDEKGHWHRVVQPAWRMQKELNQPIDRLI